MAHLVDVPKDVKTIEIVNPAEFVFPSGFKTQTKRQVWIDGAFKKSCSEDKTFEERKIKHVVKFVFDWSGVNMQPLLERLTNVSNSLIVTAQQHVRQNIEADEILEDMTEKEKTFEFSVAELLEVKRSTPEITKGKRTINKINSVDDLAELQKLIAAKLEALQAK